MKQKPGQPIVSYLVNNRLLRKYLSTVNFIQLSTSLFRNELKNKNTYAIFLLEKWKHIFLLLGITLVGRAFKN